MLWGQDFNAAPEVLKKAATVRLALFDVDGVLTDGNLHITASGEAVKVFNVLDGHGLKLLLDKFEVGVITARESGAVAFRMQELGITHYYPGSQNKLDAFNTLIEKLGVSPEECSYMGDDVVDLPVMLQCGLAITTPNAHPIVKQYADWTTPVPGGSGAVRWACDLLLHAGDHYNELISGFLDQSGWAEMER